MKIQKTSPPSFIQGCAWGLVLGFCLFFVNTFLAVIIYSVGWTPRMQTTDQSGSVFTVILWCMYSPAFIIATAVGVGFEFHWLARQWERLKTDETKEAEKSIRRNSLLIAIPVGVVLALYGVVCAYFLQGSEDGFPIRSILFPLCMIGITIGGNMLALRFKSDKLIRESKSAPDPIAME